MNKHIARKYWPKQSQYPVAQTPNPAAPCPAHKTEKESSQLKRGWGPHLCNSAACGTYNHCAVPTHHVCSCPQQNSHGSVLPTLSGLQCFAFITSHRVCSELPYMDSEPSTHCLDRNACHIVWAEMLTMTLPQFCNFNSFKSSTMANSGKFCWQHYM